MRRIIISSIVTVLATSAILYAATFVKIEPMTIAIKSSKVSVTGTATALPATGLVGREAIAIYNNTSATEVLYIGGSDVTTSNGFPLTSSAPAITLDLDATVIIYGISDGTTVDVRVLEAK